MIDYNYKQRFTDHMGRIFYLAIKHKFHFSAITNKLSNSTFLRRIEYGDYSMLMDYTPEELFTSIFNFETDELSLMKYNDAYWCGYVYANIFYEFNKPFSYIFLTLPLKELIDKYPVYHEMDITAIFELFEEKEKEETILSRLLSLRKMKMTTLSKLTNIPVATIKHYKKSNENIFKANFITVKKIALALEVDDGVFLNSL